MVTFDDQLPIEAIKSNIDKACALRSTLFDEKTNAYRLINGEGDFLPGLIVDKYADILVLQITTKGMDLLRSWLVEFFTQKLKPRCIYERSQVPSRKEEGLLDAQGWLAGEKCHEVDILENGLKFKVSFETGQKTGFFLDHREMRQMVRGYAARKKVLNAFSYTGGFSVYALAGGASQVDSIDISDVAIQLARYNASLNGFNEEQQGFHTADVFNFLREKTLDYDLIILDPPAFAKRLKDVVAACRGYKDINRLVLQKMPPKSLLLTSSCSYHVNEELFQKVVFQSTVEAQRTAKIIGRHRLAPDHPINICHPEGSYLKSLLLYVD
jgi:23S rRNA (cytosine1962-C5)-methyltransferase